MGRVCCGHWNFTVRGNWILCQDCEWGIAINSTKGQRLLDRKKGRPLMDSQQQAIYDSLVESYKELVKQAGTNDPNALANLANYHEST